MNPLMIRIEEKKDYAIVHMSGSATSVSKQSEEVEQMRELFKEIAKKNITKVLINLKQVDYIASNTIGSILAGNSIIRKIGGKLAIYNASDYLKGILDIVQLPRVVPVCDSFEDALKEVS
jgi:anti-anti-sigma factor